MEYCWRPNREGVLEGSRALPSFSGMGHKWALNLPCKDSTGSRHRCVRIYTNVHVQYVSKKRFQNRSIQYRSLSLKNARYGTATFAQRRFCSEIGGLVLLPSWYLPTPMYMEIHVHSTLVHDFFIYMWPSIANNHTLGHTNRISINWSWLIYLHILQEWARQVLLQLDQGDDVHVGGRKLIETIVSGCHNV